MKNTRRVARAASAAGLLALTMLTATGCGPTITAPDVVGMRLDDAHRAFEAMDVDEFEDVDILGDREDIIFLDANWVVINQEPAAGTKGVDTGTTIRLEVGHEDEHETLDMIPSDSPFAVEMGVNDEDEPEAADEPEPTDDPEPTDQPEPTPTVEPTPSEEATSEGPSDKERQAAVRCARRPGNAGEIYAWYSYGSDGPPDALRLGGGWVWSWGAHVCMPSAQLILRTNPPLPGYCTEVGTVAANPGYPVNSRPAPRLAQIIGQEGDC